MIDVELGCCGQHKIIWMIQDFIVVCIQQEEKLFVTCDCLFVKSRLMLFKLRYSLLRVRSAQEILIPREI